jgi:transposase
MSDQQGSPTLESLLAKGDTDMPTTPDTVKMAVAIEVSSAKWVVASTADGHRIRRKALDSSAAAERLQALLDEVMEAKRRWGVAPTAVVGVAYEAGQEGFWLVRALRERGVLAEVIDPASLPVTRRRRAKTDRLDAEALVLALWRYWAGDSRALRMVRVPTEAAEDSREWQRERDRLMAEQRSCGDRIRKKLRSQGVWSLGRAWRVQLRAGQVRGFAGRPLGALLQASLVIELDRLETAEAKLKELTGHLEHLDAPAQQRIHALQQLCGIGLVSARALALRLFWRTFSNRRQVGACVGLVSLPYDSGTMRQDQGISKAGDPRLRALLIELAWLWLRYQPNSALTLWFRRRSGGSGARGKRTLLVAVARRLAIALWRYLKDGVLPEGARLKAAAA